MFWQKKQQNSDEYEKTTKRIIVIEADLERVKNLLDNTGSSIASLRGLVNRKIGGKDVAIEEEAEPRGIDDGFNELRKINKESKP